VIQSNDTNWEFRLSTDGTLFAFYDPGNAPWFAPKTPLEEWAPNPKLEGWNIPEPWMKGRFVESHKIDGFGFEWIRFLPVEVTAKEVLKIVAKWAEMEPVEAEALARLVYWLGRKGYRLPEDGDDDE
jgi:hypothetical protein